ncbi:MAG TPA: formate--tetrahydrofolate ligase [Planctomycetota bacterium]|nr:formate--tetrahydrofolate ligase [Planctomycetota bacterium]
MPTDLRIEQSVIKLPILEIAAKLRITEADVLPYGRSIAKIPLDVLKSKPANGRGKLVLVTAMTPTPSGLGKTTMTIGLGDALNRIGKRASVCLREPSLGPYFGIKGGGTGGGWSQLTPAEDINMHFTGDISAVGKSTNLLAALIDNHLHHHNQLRLDQRRITWRRTLDLNDRALRHIVIGLGTPQDGVPRNDGFLITPASEVMAILCLAEDFPDLRRRIRKIIVGYTRDRKPITCDRLKADAAMAVLLRDAMLPNLVQTLEHTPAFVHGGPFANIAHGCSSAVATRISLQLSEYTVTEAGFGADLGGEKFFDIKCRIAGLTPAVAVIVATVQAIEYHGGYARRGGFDNLRRHVENVRKFGVTPVVAINRFPSDSPAAIRKLRGALRRLGVRSAESQMYSKGSAEGVELAEAVVDAAGAKPRFHPLYDLDGGIRAKIETIAREIYRASKVHYEKPAAEMIETIEGLGRGNVPICMAKTQMSFTDNPKVRGAPEGFEVTINQVNLSAGAGFVVAQAGNIVVMPGLPRTPAAEKVKIDGEGNLLGMA